MLSKLENNIGYTFKEKKYLYIALTHSSYANESNGKLKSYERLEFLGDSVLSIIVSDYIFKNCPKLPEGDLTNLRASLFCERTLCMFSKELEVGKYIFFSKGEKRSGGDQRPSILADVFEAILAAIYLDGGIEEARKLVLRFVVPKIQNPRLEVSFRDYKTDLQEIVQKNPEETIEYVLVDESGPDHNKHFIMEVRLNNNAIGRGGGRSKKEAEQQAAREALVLMGY